MLRWRQLNIGVTAQIMQFSEQWCNRCIASAIAEQADATPGERH